MIHEESSYLALFILLCVLGAGAFSSPNRNSAKMFEPNRVQQLEKGSTSSSSPTSSQHDAKPSYTAGKRQSRAVFVAGTNNKSNKHQSTGAQKTDAFHVIKKLAKPATTTANVSKAPYSISSAGYKRAPNAPKRFRPAFIFFSAMKHKEIRADMGDKALTEKTSDISKLVSDAWKKLTPEERSKWDAMALDDKKRYDMEKKLYQGPWRVPSNRKTKYLNPPKRPMSAFLAFANCRRGKVKNSMPRATNGQVSKALAAMWRESPQHVRQTYIREENEKRQEHRVAMAAWRKRNDNKRKETLLKQRKSSIHKSNKNKSDLRCNARSVAVGLPGFDLRTFTSKKSYQDHIMEHDPSNYIIPRANSEEWLDSDRIHPFSGTSACFTQPRLPFFDPAQIARSQVAAQFDPFASSLPSHHDIDSDRDIFHHTSLSPFQINSLMHAGGDVGMDSSFSNPHPFSYNFRQAGLLSRHGEELSTLAHDDIILNADSDHVADWHTTSAMAAASNHFLIDANAGSGRRPYSSCFSVSYPMHDESQFESYVGPDIASNTNYTHHIEDSPFDNETGMWFTTTARRHQPPFPMACYQSGSRHGVTLGSSCYDYYSNPSVGGLDASLLRIKSPATDPIFHHQF